MSAVATCEDTSFLVLFFCRRLEIDVTLKWKIDLLNGERQLTDALQYVHVQETIFANSTERDKTVALALTCDWLTIAQVYAASEIAAPLRKSIILVSSFSSLRNQN